MIEVLKIRIQYLNGQNVIKQIKLDRVHRFETLEEMECRRKLKEMKLQYRADQQKSLHKPTVSVLLDYKTKL